MAPALVDAFKNLMRHGRNHGKGHPPEPQAPDARGLRQQDPPVPQLGPPEAKHTAELIVKEERRQRSSMPTYVGLEGYDLIDKMGDGAFSHVYRAVEVITGKSVAIKVVRKLELNASQAGDKHLNAQFKKKPRVTERANILKEVQIMRGTSHQSIVKLFSFSESEEHYFLVMELMPGGELFHQIVKLTYFSENLSRHVILQVAQGISYLHEERGVVHRDIKPENLLFERIDIIPSNNPIKRPYDEEKEDEGEFIPGVGGGGIGRVKIADFGLSKVVWNEETMTPCGTVGYTAPEIVKDERYSKSVDMWALGCVLYTLLCGFPPFYDESINVLTEKVAKGYYTFLSPWWDDISDSAKDLITHLLCVDPSQRYTINEFLAHPWCNAAPAPPPLPTPFMYGNAKDLSSAQPLDSPLLSAARGGRGHDGRSPGLAVLKEAFDITYAVHRMEEEGARRRKYNGPGGAVPHGYLTGLNEDDEDDDDEMYDSDGESDKEHNRRQGEGHAPTYNPRAPVDPQRQQNTSVMEGRAGQRDQGRGRTGMGATANTSSARSKGRIGHKTFELDMDNATLLGRRRFGTPGVPSPLRKEGLRADDTPTLRLPPGSPMTL